ncbi:MAG: restriction endonuclease [Roseiflexus sp.]
MSRRRSRHSSDVESAIGGLVLAGFLGFYFVWQTVANLALPWRIAAAALVLSVLFVLLWLLHLLIRHVRQQRLIRKELLALTPAEFEERVLLLLKDLGWSNLRLRGGSGDRGVDLEGEFQGVRYIIQCKRYSKSVPPSMVRDLVGALHIQKADRALLVTTSSFTAQGYAEARDQAVELWDGKILAQKISEADRLREDPLRKQAVQRRRLATVISLMVINGVSVLTAFAIAGPPLSVSSTIRTVRTPSPESIAGSLLERSVSPAPSPTHAPPSEGPQPTAQPTPTAVPTERPVPTTTVFNGGNVRAAPNMRGAVLDQVHAGEIVELLGRSADGNWLYIRNPRGQVGWTHHTLLNLAADFDERLEVVSP